MRSRASLTKRAVVKSGANCARVMKLIVGLGNIGKEYAETRHNIGWDAVSALATRQSVSFSEKSRFHAFVTECQIENERVLLALPTTYMNESGVAVQALSAFYKLEPSSILIVQDEMDLPLGALKFSRDASSAGHNGIRSIEQHLSTQATPRLRLGINRPAGSESKSFVLDRFSSNEQLIRETLLKNAVQAISDWVLHGFDKAQMTWNGIKG